MRPVSFSTRKVPSWLLSSVSPAIALKNPVCPAPMYTDPRAVPTAVSSGMVKEYWGWLNEGTNASGGTTWMKADTRECLAGEPPSVALTKKDSTVPWRWSTVLLVIIQPLSGSTWTPAKSQGYLNQLLGVFFFKLLTFVVMCLIPNHESFCYFYIILININKIQGERHGFMRTNWTAMPFKLHRDIQCL